MRKYLLLIMAVVSLKAMSQDSTMNSLMKDMDKPASSKKAAVQIFNGVKTINANTTEMTGRGKMDFRITHNFNDIDGREGILNRFLGLDEAKDVRIGFHFGLTDRLDLNIARDKGAGAITNNGAGSASRFYEVALKYLLMQQRENDPKHPVSLALFVNTAIATSKTIAPFDNFDGTFKKFSDRMSQVVQLIVAKKIGKMSLQLNPTYVNTNHVIKNDNHSMYALGGAIRFPAAKNFNIIVDYFHSFRSGDSKDFFKDTARTGYKRPLKFTDPLGISFEIVTPGHVFNLNFTNSTDILENRFIPYTNRSWTKGQFRWGFTISRKFVISRAKEKNQTY
jgi:Membrane bound beta barrel domain (DUF5777)